MKLLKTLIALMTAITPTAIPQKVAAQDIDDILRVLSPAAAVIESANNYGLKGALGCGAAVGVTSVTVDFLKGAIAQPRPVGDNRGMPSAHAASTATGLGCMLGQQGWRGTTPLYAAATLIVAYKRVEKRAHTVEQVVAGAALGTAIGYLGTQHLPKGQRVYVSTNGGGNTVVGMQFTLQKPTGTGRSSKGRTRARERSDLIAYANSDRR